MLIVPYAVDVPMERWPIANFVVIGFTTFFSIYAWANPETVLAPLILDGWSLQGMLGYMLLHVGPVHLLGNMIFLWVFGNAVCAKLGNWTYLVVYVLLGLSAAAAHNLLSGGPAIGASGAINGIVGMFLVWYPRNELSCYWCFLIFYFGSYEADSRIMILVWLVFDLWGALTGGGSVAYAAHLGGFAAGFGLATALLAMGWVRMARLEESLYQMLGYDIENRRLSAGEDEPLVAPNLLDQQSAARREPSHGNNPPRGGEQRHIRVRCTCGRKLKIAAHHAGKRGRCPACSARIEIPSA